MLAEIVFATRILGLVAGEQKIDVQADATVKSVEVLRDGERVARLHQAPWSAVVPFGSELAPHDLTVIGFDAEGRELGRDTQAVNVTRPPAELGILLDRDARGNVTATIRWNHFANKDPAYVSVKLDGKNVPKRLTQSKIDLGELDASRIHVLGVDVTFPDRVRSRKEIVFGGGFSEQMPAELTPVVVRQKKETAETRASCFEGDDRALPEATIEHGAGSAIFILNGEKGALGRINIPDHRSGGTNLFALHNADIDIINPVAQEIRRANGVTRLFDADTLDGQKGTGRVVMMARTPQGTAQVTDAVGAAALRALRGGRRRVVVLVLGDLPARDYSVHAPAIMRRYLERVGVPFRVWSLVGPRPDLAETWGEVKDISSAAALLAATEDLRKELDSQRVAWLPVAPLEAFRVRTSGDCAYEPLAVADRVKPSASATSAR
jgi:hypothetical protein